jgi:hypothetical protein
MVQWLQSMNTKLVSTFLFAVLALGSAAPARPKGEHLQGSGPLFDPLQFFTGSTYSEGVFEDRGGRPTKRVRTETRGRVIAGELRMEQDLFIQGHPPQRRSWRMRRVGTNRFEATANDIIGTARGVAHGSYFHWTFTLATRPGNPLYNVRMIQDMYLQPGGRTMINRTKIRKFGILAAQVTEQFHRSRPRTTAGDQ